MTVIGIFCRPNHPAGYGGQLPPETTLETFSKIQHSLGAHGYVTWIVKCDDWVELLAVRDKFKVGSSWPGRNDDWYAGPLDMVIALEGWLSKEATDHHGQKWPVDRTHQSIGDNRAVAYLTAKEVLS